jgi:hypothetical protein
MKRRKTFTLRRIVLGLAVVAILAPVAEAKPTPVDTDTRFVEATEMMTLGPGEIPSYRKQTLMLGPGEIPSLVDDMTRPSSEQGKPAAVSDDGGGYDIGYGVVSSAVIVLLLAVGGAVVAIRRSRHTRPATV